ncbi:tRNA 5-methoxyuridine(34)/uridine 5-oxyacetic acid(34) synthase CmoB [Methylococcus sp. Mc7]|uniref:tRNA 5-methoxyuridine(34)/uridine 5-oxyacetic acid(34) synthase CmoB n=1 Tax=Methylococcus sp. Mc7 TaxID=2860258 RepID=UPI001C52CF46|nr:tRNA 5-methoxyuridine(34)/uridine 5-oxyacetic acid(34) synthase CmoB [Methylococcus sp. Mc7]QXP85623.1 tRNA 5-methoxyuridine(34)/uridine 5-oxyacetic acid(34) synthase CmoB [Methylococcus sp. Mc7]
MSDRDLFSGLLAPRFFPGWAELLLPRIEARRQDGRHGDWPGWLALLRELPNVAPTLLDFAADAVKVGAETDCDGATRRSIETALRRLHPWRKGPYAIHGILIDTEWRSDLKWRRLDGAIAPLAGRRVLDVGCGNGYHAWRMLGAGAKSVIGIDPTLLSVAQFLAVRHFAGDWPVAVLPLGIEDFPSGTCAFDTVFSMGVLYHRRSPFDHLAELKGCLRPGGELVLETLVIEGEAGQVLVPEGRYAQMRNVWFIPSPPTLSSWLARAGFRRARLIDVSPTTIREQRSTGWMRFQSLADFLDPDDPSRTVEGHPAPRRAIFLAEAP